MEAQSLVKIQQEGNDIVIRVAIDDLVFIVENDTENNFKIIDKEKFANEFIGQLQDTGDSNDTEKGINRVESVFESAYVDTYENGCEGIIDTDDTDEL